METDKNVNIYHKNEIAEITAEEIYAFMRLARTADVVLSAAKRIENNGVIYYAFEIHGSDAELVEDLAQFKKFHAEFFKRNSFLGQQSDAYDGKVVFWRQGQRFKPNRLKT
jgi:hypothetical protein